MTPGKAHCQCTCGLKGCAGRVGAHGLEARYEQGCRCDLCKSANRLATARRRKAANDGMRPEAKRWGQPWTSAELEVATREDMTCRQAAEMLGRTMLAVRNVRERCKTDPKFIALLGAAEQEDRHDT